jgi:DNA-binding response OmpR family regulator
VLVCDDTESIRRLLRINLELDGFDVVEANDGAGAVELLGDLGTGHTSPVVIILDSEMSPRDGWWALQRIRERPSSAHVPVIMASAQSDGRLCEGGRDLGPDAWVRKPFDPDVVLALVDRFSREGRGAPPPTCP